MVSRHELVFQIVETELARKYSPCSADCIYMALRVCDQIRETSLLNLLIGSYETMGQAKREMARRGHKSLSDVLAEHLDIKPNSMLIIGDVAIVINDGVEHVAVCMGGNFVVKGELGKEVYTLNDVVMGFEV